MNRIEKNALVFVLFVWAVISVTCFVKAWQRSRPESAQAKTEESITTNAVNQCLIWDTYTTNIQGCCIQVDDCWSTTNAVSSRLVTVSAQNPEEFGSLVGYTEKLESEWQDVTFKGYPVPVYGTCERKDGHHWSWKPEDTKTGQREPTSEEIASAIRILDWAQKQIAGMAPTKRWARGDK